ncbi:hypothetical protein WN51_02339 [Melipona quadrifasciata]|uniref:Uncharacterized protein n=1 Tax=Melipona quadrifasciata TaxID=166423 RepID=A0A0M8ZXU2_9HYME|nr:hypothetical protein WN51_02339 [Melipona quadrifasciata]
MKKVTKFLSDSSRSAKETKENFQPNKNGDLAKKIAPLLQVLYNTKLLNYFDNC